MKIRALPQHDDIARRRLQFIELGGEVGGHDPRLNGEPARVRLFIDMVAEALR